MAQIDRISVILPSYNPGESILAVIQNVIRQGFYDVIVVNDGSRDELSYIFDEVAKIDGCTVLRHTVNRGKGAALKTGLAYFMENRPDGVGVVTIDDDGQHLPDDIRLCAETMVERDVFALGMRDFSKPDVPPKSRFGNRLTAMVFKVGVGLNVSDTQTGLRAIPRKYIEMLARVDGDRFEYETNVLLTAKKESFEIAEIPIRTVYIDGNKGTHYRAFADSFKIIVQFAKYAFGALMSYVIDILGFYLLLLVFGDIPLNHIVIIFICTFVSRAASSIFNFFFNKNIVFGHKDKDTRRALLRYYTLCGTALVLSSVFVTLISSAPFINTPLAITFIKIVVDTGLFVMNYLVQKRWVYK